MLYHRVLHASQSSVQELAAHPQRFGSPRQKSAMVSMLLSTFMSAATMLEAVSYTVHVIPSGFVAKSPEGSTTVHPYNNTAYEPIELGASIFIDINKNLWRAANEFNLSLTVPEFGDEAIWDGEKMLFTVRFPVASYLQ
jgi:hypothetical protein